MDYDPRFTNTRMTECCGPMVFVNDFFEKDERVVMQFTGLHDKNGKEIYEGDIIKVGKNIYEVEWGASGWLPFIDRKLQIGIRYFKVIGNIYENPELLKYYEKNS
jgi:uncharacterized phage protein (TIGR01671 family)